MRAGSFCMCSHITGWCLRPYGKDVKRHWVPLAQDLQSIGPAVHSGLLSCFCRHDNHAQHIMYSSVVGRM